MRITLKSRTIRTRVYEDFTTCGLLIQTIVYKQSAIRSYGFPAANTQWIDQVSGRARVWH